VAADAPAAFFSYCREDSDFALRLAEDLKATGAAVWIDQLDIEPGQRRDRTVEDALNTCPRMLVILSPASVQNENVRDEISFGFRKQKTIIPVLHLDCDIPLRLERHQQVDFRTDYGRGLKVLLKTLGVDQPVEGETQAPKGGGTPSAARARMLKVWEVKGGRQLRTLVGHSDAVRGVALSRDGRLAVSASFDTTLKVWDLASGCELRSLEGHSADVYGVAMSSDGRLAVSASFDKTLEVWDVESGIELRSLEGHSDSVRGVALSGDGRLAISASYDKTLKVWEVESGRELRTLVGHTGYVRGVALSGDGRRAVSASLTRR
jgi:TIR domain/WD domain, G-beta repeat